MSRTITWSRCPYCRKTISVSSRQGTGSRSMIGERVLSPCPYCDKLISNGKKEWPEMSSEEQFKEKARFFLTDIVGGFAFGFGPGALIGINLEGHLILFGLIGFCLVFFLLRKLNKNIINDSIKRYNEKTERFNFSKKLNEIFNISEVAKVLEEVKSRFQTNLLLITKYIALVKDIEEVSFGDFKEKKELQKLYSFFDKLFFEYLYFYYKGLIFSFIENFNLDTQMQDLEKVNLDFLELLYTYMPKDKSETEVKAKFTNVGIILDYTKKLSENFHTKLVTIPNSEIKNLDLLSDFHYLENPINLQELFASFDNYVKQL